MSGTARVQAQAKVNLFLHVFAERDDEGYHGLWTMFQRIDLADDIVVRVGGESRFLDVAGPALPREGIGPTDRNLAFRAAVAYVSEAGSALPAGFSIELTKRIPVGGGLGGGSADAGAVLRALNALSSRPLDSARMQSIASSLGSDVAFLASEMVIAQAAGRGERIVPVNWTVPVSPVALVVPNFGVATRDAYAWLDSDRPVDPYKGVTGFGAPSAFPGWPELATGGNDFEPVVERRHPVLRDYRQKLVAAGAQMARLAGSGSCVFGVFPQNSALPSSVGSDAIVVSTRTSARVVQVEVLQ